MNGVGKLHGADWRGYCPVIATLDRRQLAFLNFYAKLPVPYETLLSRV
jgi:hypothetical protein